MITIDFKLYIRQRYWFGKYWWTLCDHHRHYVNGCEHCEQGVWSYDEGYEYMHSSEPEEPDDFQLVESYNFIWRLKQTGKKWNGSAFFDVYRR